MSESNQAVICKVYTRPHPSADRLLLGLSSGFQVIVGLDTKNEELGVFFQEGLQLSEEYAKANNLIRIKNPDGTYSGGFFEENRRVRCQKFRGEKSDGYWAPLSSLAFTSYKLDKLKEGDSFDVLNKVPICNKYFTPATAQIRGQSQKKQTRGATKMFPKHFDTAQLRRHIQDIPSGSVISVSLKIHGSSGRTTHTYDEITLPWYKRWMKKLGYPIQTHKWTYLNGSRNVILKEENINTDSRGRPSGWHSLDFRAKAASKFDGKLHKGEIVYYEIVGYEGHDKPIMPAVNCNHIQDKKLRKEIEGKYGQNIVYSYGCPNGEFEVYVYRIVYAGEDGHIIDLPWGDVKERCKQLNVKHVPEIVAPHIYNGDQDRLLELCNDFAEQRDFTFPSHPREGICLRVDNSLGLKVYKNKSFLFGLLEGYLKEDDTYVDTEEIS